MNDKNATNTVILIVFYESNDRCSCKNARNSHKKGQIANQIVIQTVKSSRASQNDQLKSNIGVNMGAIYPNIDCSS